GVVAHQAPVLAPQRVHRAERLRDRRPAVAGGKGRFLVGHGDIDAEEPVLADRGRELTKFPGGDGETLVASRYAQLLEPVTVNGWRARMIDRPAGHSRARPGRVHSEIRFSRRIQARRPSIGSPRTTE